MKTMPAGKFKDLCLKTLDEVARTKSALVITKRGKPVAKLIPVSAGSAGLIGSLAGKVAIKGDILSTGAKWHAQS